MRLLVQESNYEIIEDLKNVSNKVVHRCFRMKEMLINSSILVSDGY